MPGIYVAGYDGSESACAAVRFAAAMAAAAGGRTVAVAVYRPAPQLEGGHRDGRLVQQINEQAHRRCRELLAGLSVPDVEPLVLAARSPTQALHQLAAQREVALIAVGRTGKHWMTRPLAFSTAECLASGVRAPVACVPARWAGRILTVGVAYDATHEAEVALEYAVTLTRSLGAALRVFSAFEPVVAGLGDLPIAGNHALNAELRADRELALQHAVQRLPSELHAEGRLLDGDHPARALIGVGGEIDVLVTGSRGYGPPQAVVAGGTARYLLDHAPFPVLVVPRGTAHHTVQTGDESKASALPVTG